MATGVNISKVVGYSILSPPTGLNISKVVAYAVLDTTAATLLSISVTPADITISSGTQQYTATGYYNDDTTSDITTSCAWTSSLTGVATIGAATGLATAVAQGTTTITATLSGVSGTTTLSVTTGTTSSDALWTDSSGAIGGRFCNAPDGQVVYANGVDVCIWGGNEMQIGAFLTATAAVGDDGTATGARDFTERMQNTKTDSDNLASIGGGVDSSTVLMLHCDGTDGSTTITDSSASAHTVTAVNNAALDTAYKKFGTAALYFDGTGDYCTIPDHANWNFGTGNFSIDFQVRQPTDGATHGICGQYVDSNNYWYLTMTCSASWTAQFKFKVVSSGVTIASYNTGYINVTFWGATKWNHVELTRDGASMYFFLNGVSQTLQVGTAISTSAMPDLAAVLEIGGAYNHTYVLSGWLDEFRISKGVARHITDFTAPASAYAADGTVNVFLVGSPRPLKGMKVYVQTANTSTSTLTGKQWIGSTWSSITLTDNTASGGISLAQTGTVTWDSTVTTAKPRFLEGYFLYWYQFTLSAGTAELYQVTIDAPFQKIVDLWDGQYRGVSALYKRISGNYNEETVNVLRQDFDLVHFDTYADFSLIGAFSDPTNCIEIGFTEKQCGLYFVIPPGGDNTTAATTMSVDYWDGVEYVSVGEVSDGTSSSGISFAKTGVVTWNNANLANETKCNKASGVTKTTGTALTSTVPLFFYRVRFDKAMSASVYVDYVGGITAPKDISHYKFPIFAQGRVLLCGDMSGKKNKVTCSGKWLPQVYNGDDSVDIYIGDEGELTCGTELFSQYGGNLYSLILLFKDTEFWVIAGQDIEQWSDSIFPVSTSIGCPAPLTLKTITLAAEPAIGLNRSLAIWQGANGLYMSDGRAPIPIHGDIKAYFDRNDSRCIKASMVGDSVGFMDEEKQEYHWLFASGTSTTTLNKELVYDIIKNKWFEIDRGTGMDLQCGVSVQDVYGNQYSYGFIDTGYIERLEYGTTFDGNDIVSTMQIGDYLPTDTIMAETMLDKIKLITKAKTTTTNNISVTHYGDGDTTGTTLKDCFDPNKTGYRIAMPFLTDNLGGYTFHSLKFAQTTNDETCGFEPLALGITYHIVREG